MAYKYDPLKYNKTFDNMFGKGAYDKGIADAREKGAKLGELKLLRQAALEAAKKKKEEEEEKEKAEKSKKAKENENLERRIEASGGSTEKKQSKIGKFLNLDPDNNLLFDTFDILNRPLNAVMNIGKNEEERKKGTSKEDKYLEEMRKKPIWETGISGKMDVLKDQLGAAWEGFSGKEKTIGSDVLEEAGMEKGWKRGVAGFGLDVAADPLNVAGAGLIKGAAKGVGKVGGLTKKIPGVEKAVDAVGDVFSNTRKMKETLTKGKTTDTLQEISDRLFATRSELMDKSLSNISKAKIQAGKTSGAKVGEIMEEPLTRNARKLDFNAAPNAMNAEKILPEMQGILKQSTKADTPLLRNSPLDTKTTMTNKINVPEPTDKEVRAWLKANNLPGADKKGRVSQFNKNFYKAENEQTLRASYQVETKIQKVLASTSDIEKAAKTLTKDPVIKSNIKQAANTLMQSNAELRDFAKANGIMDIGDIEGYMSHFATKEAQKFLKESGQSLSSGAAKIGGDTRILSRSINENVKNANAIMKKKTGVDQFFNPDAFTATAGGQHKTINYIISEMAKDQITKNKEIARILPSGAKARKGFEAVEVNGKTYEMTKGAAETIKRYESAISDEGLQKILRGYDKVQNVWKKSALFSVGYHARNIIGNTFNMSISDMNLGTALAKQTTSISYLEKLKAFRNGRTTKLDVPEKIAKQYDEFINSGLRATGVGADFADETAEKAMSEVAYRSKSALGKSFHEFSQIGKVEGAGGKVKQAANSFFETSRRFGDESDEIARFTLYRHLRDKGMSVKEATHRVKEVLFDYNDLTVVEREGFKRIAPFYTFTRKNLEFQVKNLANNPAKYNRLNNLIQESYKETEMDQSIVPDYLKNNLAIPMMGTNSLLNATLPAADLGRLSEPLKMGTDMLTPLAKVPIELATNNKMFNGAPIEEYEDQDGKLFGKSVPKKLEYAVQSAFAPLRNIAGMQQQLEEGQTGIGPYLKGVGGQLTKPYDEEAFQLQADYKENDRLQGIKKKMEKEEGKEVMTIQDMKKQGIPTNETEDYEKELFDKLGYDTFQRLTLLNVKKKVEKGDPTVAIKARSMLEEKGIPEEVIEYIVNY